MGFQSGVNQAIGTVGAMASVGKVVKGQQEAIAKQEESNKLQKESNEQLDAQNNLLAIEEADKLNKEGLENEEAINDNEKNLGSIAKEIDTNASKQRNTTSPIWKKHYQKAIDSLQNEMESIDNRNKVLRIRQEALGKRKDILDKQTGGKLSDYLYFGEGKEENWYGKK